MWAACEACESCLQVVLAVKAVDNFFTCQSCWVHVRTVKAADSCQGCQQLAIAVKAVDNWELLSKLLPPWNCCQSCWQLVTIIKASYSLWKLSKLAITSIRAFKAVTNMSLPLRLLTACYWWWPTVWCFQPPRPQTWLQNFPSFQSVSVFRMGDRLSCWDERKLQQLNLFYRTQVLL